MNNKESFFIFGQMVTVKFQGVFFKTSKTQKFPSNKSLMNVTRLLNNYPTWDPQGGPNIYPIDSSYDVEIQRVGTGSVPLRFAACESANLPLFSSFLGGRKRTPPARTHRQRGSQIVGLRCLPARISLLVVKVHFSLLFFLGRLYLMENGRGKQEELEYNH